MKTIFSLVFLIGALCLPSMAAADKLETLLRNSLDPRTSDATVIDPQFKGLGVSGSSRMFLNKRQAVASVRQARKVVSDFTITDFKILNRTSAGGFTSVVYKYQVRARFGQSTLVSRGVAHEIWENRNGRWFVLFGVQRE